ncbi:MAG: hypothetical protein K2X66_16820 [Cyanobacteria bacterium]|nr:hypothetical protein [Cyanobacteriota bacterium]
MADLGLGGMNPQAVQQLAQLFKGTLNPEQQQNRKELKDLRDVFGAQLNEIFSPEQKAFAEQLKASGNQAIAAGTLPSPDFAQALVKLNATATPQQAALSSLFTQQKNDLQASFEKSLSGDQKALEQQLKAAVLLNSIPGGFPPFKA